MEKLSDKNITVRVPTVLVEHFQKSCKKNYRTMSQVIRDLMEEYIKRSHKIYDGKKD
jgi:metal-responsive CopG/Arc/MetJ family transcriptional regulator